VYYAKEDANFAQLEICKVVLDVKLTQQLGFIIIDKFI
jgi:hypothetical protein